MKTWNGPIDYTEVVYPLYCYSVAEMIKHDARDGKPVAPEAVAWASRFQLLPRVNVDIIEASLPDADSY